MSSIRAEHADASGAQTTPKGLKRVMAAAMAGIVVEWHEFIIYGPASAPVFGKVCCIHTNSVVNGIISDSAFYAAGSLLRPFDGEWCGAILLDTEEHSPNNRRGFWPSLPQAVDPMGNLIATIIMLALSRVLSEKSVLPWGWRMALWFYAVVVIIGCWIHTRVSDAPIFKKIQAKAEELKKSQYGVAEVPKNRWRQVLVVIGAHFADNILYYTAVTFSITCINLVEQANTTRILFLMFGAHFLHFFMVPLMSSLSDILGHKPIYLIGAVLTASWGLFAFPMMNTGNNLFIIIAITIGLGMEFMTKEPYSALLAEMYPTHMRYTALSLCYQVSQPLSPV